MCNFFASISCCSSLEIESWEISSIEAVEEMLPVLSGSLQTASSQTGEIRCLLCLFVSAFWAQSTIACCYCTRACCCSYNAWLFSTCCLLIRKHSCSFNSCYWVWMTCISVSRACFSFSTDNFLPQHVQMPLGFLMFHCLLALVLPPLEVP